jgi:hypothetical protein
MTTNGGAAPRQEIALAQPTASDVLERIIIHGDLSKLSQDQKVEYYRLMCESLGLNPNTRPFAYLLLNGKTVLYALRDCTDQLRRIHKVSVIETSQEEINGVYVVVCKVQNGEGRTDIARGAVDLGSLKGEALANAIMKTETKAKRRATLSICGLGVLDETEIEDMTAPKTDKNGRVKGRDLAGRKTAYAAKRDGTDDVFNDIRRQIANAPECEILAQISDSYSQELADLPARYMLILSEEFEDKWQDLGGDLEDSPVRARRKPG